MVAELTSGGGSVAELVSPRATRLATPRWLDARLALGVLLVLLSVVAGARLLATGDDLTAVYVAAHDLVPGQQLAAADLSVGHVRLQGEGGSYVAAAAAPPIGYVVTRYVGARELLPAAALAPTAAGADSRLVTVPVQPGHLSESLDRGDLVDVYVTAKTASGQAVPAPTLVLAGVPVQSREGGARTFGGDSALAIVLTVPRADVRALVHAVESGTIDLVALPAGAAEAVRSP